MAFSDFQHLLRLHAAVTVFMVGLIWFVQVVHYPMLARVGAGAFVEYERTSNRITAWVVGPPILAEIGLAVALVWRAPGALTWTGVALIGVIMASTWGLQVPAHRRLEREFEAATHAWLVRTNWIRTLGWTARGVLALAMLGAHPA